MSVTTTADRKIDEAKDSIENARKALLEVVEGDIWGAGDYNETYTDLLYDSIKKLDKMKRKL
ncbi:MAG: hypothetical protein PQJ49_04530 [Sphaerochaetaceae bacterium]|nr:hypothetical protein [Sphaerochaetaceae bacterium]